MKIKIIVGSKENRFKIFQGIIFNDLENIEFKIFKSYIIELYKDLVKMLKELDSIK